MENDRERGFNNEIKKIMILTKIRKKIMWIRIKKRGHST